MAFNITQFSSHIKATGTLQTNKFLVDITSPAGSIFSTNFRMNKMMQFRAEQIRIPGLNLGLERVNRYGVGPSQQFPNNVNFQDNNITFLDDGFNSIWKFFSGWMNLIFSYKSSSNTGSIGAYEVAYKTDYARDMRIRVYDNDGMLVTTVVMKDSFPVSVGDVDLNWANNNQLFKVNVTFSYREWYIDKGISLFGFGGSPAPTTSPSVPGVTYQPEIVPSTTREDLPPLAGANVSENYNPSRLNNLYPPNT
jgi:hypothetical protein